MVVPYHNIKIILTPKGTKRLGPPIPTMFGNTGISVFKKGNTGVPVLIPVFRSMMLLMRIS